LIVETWWQSFAFFTQLLYALGWVALPRGPEGAPPVVLLPGYTESSGTLWWLARKLARAGYAPVGVDYPSTFHRIERNAEYVRDRIADVRARNGGEPVAVVAHSMGGIIARTVALTTTDHGIRALLTFASPFSGTVMAYASPRRPPSVRDMTPGSRYMRTYPPDRDAGIPIRVIVAFQENIVGPPWSAALPQADTIVLKSPYGHEAPLFVDEAFVHVEGWLQEHAGATLASGDIR
jgi:pimeloyl-ACP methyl ester carboxylesterase